MAAKPADPPVIAVWTKRPDIFTSGVPNRDVTAADGIDPALIDQAVANGTHTRTT